MKLLCGDWFVLGAKMARVSINIRKLLQDANIFEKKINYAIQQVLVEYVTDVVGGLASATPLGTPEDVSPFSRYYRLYELRQRVDGHRIEGGLARGNWRVVFRDDSRTVERYNKNPQDSAVAAFERMENEYKLGKPLYIVNNVKYINKLREGYSAQAPAGTIDAVMSNYQSLARYRSAFNTALAGG